MNHGGVLATEWRLGRVNRNIGYYKNTVRHHMMLGEYKAVRDWYENWREQSAKLHPKHGRNVAQSEQCNYVGKKVLHN